MNKYCIHCGTKLKTNNKFCTNCGLNLQEEAETVRSSSLPSPSHEASIMIRRKASPKKFIISALAVILVITLGVVFLPLLYDTLFLGTAVRIDSINGQPYANRAVTISGEGFGYYDNKKTYAIIDGKDTPIISWGEHEITLLVPEGVSAGKKEVRLINPPYFNKKTVTHEFLEQTKTELTTITLSPDKDNIIEGEGFVFIAPMGSVTQSKKITIYKYQAPSLDDCAYYTVAEEYEITGPDGGHVFFEQPVYFGVDVRDADEAAYSSFQIFDELAGVWTFAETWYDEEESQLYLSTTHFSSFRRFVSDMRSGFGRLAQKTVDEANKKIDYVTDKLGQAGSKFVELSQDLWVNIKDATSGEFIGISDTNKRFIVYYRVSDAAVDPSLHDKACLMAAAFSTAYEDYRNLFGADGVPSVTKKSLVSGHPVNNPITVDVPAPIQVYIDPRNNKTGAQAKSATTGNIIMPSEYPDQDLASTCAHELFHAVQYHQLGIKLLYMSTTGLKDLVDNRYTGNDTEVYRYFANNAWFMEATAEYAGRYIGTKVGLGAPIHPRIEANRAYYTSNGSHDYGVSSFLDYILTTRQPDVNELGEGFKEMWNTVTGNYSMISSINVAFDQYVQDKLKESADTAYLNFWREVFTRSYMPEVTVISGGLLDTGAIPREKVSAAMDIKENGVGIFRYSLTPTYMWKDETALTRSFWFEVSPSTIRGDLYLLDGIEMADRVPEDSYEGTINADKNNPKHLLVPYETGEALGLVAVFKNTVEGDASIKVTLSSTTLKWDNQKDIEKKVSNTTLSSSDKLKFTPTLPKQEPDDPPFTAVVTLNDNLDYQTEIDQVENGKSFEVAAPMKEIPPDKISANIKIYRDGELVHEYQSVDLKAKARVEIIGPESISFELNEDIKQVDHSLSAKASLAGDYKFEWSFGDGSSAQQTAGGNESDITHTYVDAGEYTVKVTLYDKKGTALSADSVRITLVEKSQAATTLAPPEVSEPTTEPTPPTFKEYAWVLVDTINEDRKEVIASSNKSYEGIYEYSATVAPGSYTYSWKYVGESDDYYDPDMLNGESYATQLTISVPPTIIKGGETVSLTFNLSFTEDNLSFFDGHGSCRADWGNLRFSNEMGKTFYEIYSSVKYADKNVLSISETISAVIPAGYSEGEQEELWTGDYTGTYYVYEWKQIN